MIAVKANQRSGPGDVGTRATPADVSGDRRTKDPDSRVTSPRGKPTSQAQKITVPNVRYPPPPATRNIDGSPQRNHNTDKTSSQVIIIPNVRYHPQIVTKTFGGTHQRNHDKSVRVNNASQINKSRLTGPFPRPEPTVPRPEPTVPRPEPTVTRPEPTVLRPEPTVPRPEPTVLRPEPTVLRPEPTVLRPEPTVPRPEPTVLRPEPTVLRPEPTVKSSRANQARPPVGSPLPRPEEVPVGLSMEKEEVEEVEVQTRGQRENPDWFAWRQNRITASNAHRISHSRFVSGTSPVPAGSYLAAITGDGPNIKTRAMTWGIEREAEAVRKYQSLKSRALGRKVQVQECGLFIDAQRPWLAGSPDGIVVDKQTGQRLLCLEVKCPYKHRDNTVAQACRDDHAFCLELEEEEGEGQPPVYSLKPGHSYYTQIQCQLAVTGLRQADLAVFTLREMAIVPVTFDPDFWEETVSRLEVFYREGLLPHLRARRRAGGTAVIPEEYSVTPHRVRHETE